MDLSGQRFGRLLVIEKTAQKYRTEFLYRCRCDCGGEKLATSSWLKSGIVRSCGCLQRENRFVDITGRRVGRLIAIEPTGRMDRGSMVWRWRCDCGNEIEAGVEQINITGRVSCGCAAREQKAAQAIAMQKGTRAYGTNLSHIRSTNVKRKNSSGRVGVSWDKTHQHWQARIQFRGRAYWLGAYSRVEDAIKARKRAEKKLYGNFLEWYEARKKK
jgi:hypothetical protein